MRVEYDESWRPTYVFDRPRVTAVRCRSHGYLYIEVEDEGQGLLNLCFGQEVILRREGADRAFIPRATSRNDPWTGYSANAMRDIAIMGSWLYRPVEAVLVESGTLVLALDQQESLRVPPSDQYESWEVRGPLDGDWVICTIGGELSVFTAE